jgi:hypothetical protein
LQGLFCSTPELADIGLFEYVFGDPAVSAVARNIDEDHGEVARGEGFGCGDGECVSDAVYSSSLF